MRLLKIGSSPSCDIVLQSEYVSGFHAEMTLLDSGEIILVDKNSTNGTYVGSKKLVPNQDVTIHRGDYVRFGNEDLVWARIPALEKTDKYKSVVNIGSNFRNDVIVNSEIVSRFHASLRIDKSGKVFIVDNHSKNGTQVNGVKIQPGKPYRIKRGDNILCGTEDITDSLSQYLPPAFPLWAKITSAVAGIAAIAAIIVAVVMNIPDRDGMTVKDARAAVVYVRAKFHFELTMEDNPFSSPEDQQLLSMKSVGIPYQATAFFIDNEGRMATNRHVACPWFEEYNPEGTYPKLREEYEKYLLANLNVRSWDFFSYPAATVLKQLQTTKLGLAILNNSNNIAEVMAKIEIIQKSKVLISGAIDDITVGYAGRYYTNEDEFQRCNVLADSKTVDQDIAILQLNNKKTPTEIAKVFDLNSIPENDIEPQQDELIVVGYPYGIQWGQDDKTKSLEPNIKQTKCSKQPGKFNFEFQESSIGGSSGSPVFTKKDGNLVGVLSSGISGQTISLAVHAKYLKKLYEDEVGPIKK